MSQSKRIAPKGTVAGMRQELQALFAGVVSDSIGRLSPEDLSRLFVRRGPVAELTQQTFVLVSESDEARVRRETTEKWVNRYQGYIRNDIDPKFVVDSTIEFILEVCGRVNVGVYFFTDEDGGRMQLMEYHLNDQLKSPLGFAFAAFNEVLVPMVAENREPMHLNNKKDVVDLFGGGSCVADCEVLAMPCLAKDEVLAVVVLFRNSTQPLGSECVDIFERVFALFAERLAKVVRVHHRLSPF